MSSSCAVMLDRGRLVEAGARHDDAEPVAEAVGVDRARIDTVDLHAVTLADVGQRLHEGKLRADHR